MNDQITLLFDLGGVIMDIRRENAVAALEALGMKEANDFLGEYGQKGPFLALEKGEVTAEEFRAQVRPMLRPGVLTKKSTAVLSPVSHCGTGLQKRMPLIISVKCSVCSMDISAVPLIAI